MPLNVRGMAPLLQVFDMPTSVRFYCDVIGFQIGGNDGNRAPDFDWVLLRLGEIELMLNTAYERERRPAKPEPVRIAAHEDVSLYFGCEDVDAVYAALTSIGIVAQPPEVAPYGMKQLYLKDPDGYLLCFQRPVESVGTPN